MVERILGIDLGISSLGWAVVEYDKDNDENNTIVDCGVRLFTAAETPKEKESPNKGRREARGLRRVIKRRRVRMNTIKNLLVMHKLIDKKVLNQESGIFHSQSSRVDVWKLRHDALYRLLSGDELARVLIHIAKHRGYKFLGDEEIDKENGKVKTAGAELKKKFLEAECQSVGEWIWKERGFQGKKRNKSGDYEISIPRDFLVDEIHRIFKTQQKFGSKLAAAELQQAYSDIAFYVKPMQSIEHMVGKCTYFPEEPRAPKASPTAEQFVALGKFYATVVIDKKHQEQKIIELKTVKELMDFAISKEKLTYKELRKFLALDDRNIFKGLAYKGKQKKAKTGEDATPQEWELDKAEAEKKVWINLEGHAKFKEVLSEGDFLKLLQTPDLIDEIAKVLTYQKDKRAKKDELAKLNLEISTIEKLSKISFTDFNQLSLKAIKAILPEMIQGKRYDEAISILGKPSHEKSIFLPSLKETDIAILNPTVIRAFAQFRKVANALVLKYGSFDKVHFELAREVNTKEDRKRWEQDQDKNEKMHRQITEKLEEEGIKPNYKNILKAKLRSEQKDTCPYCQKNLHYPMIFEDGYAEIDHILPLSKSQDDSYVNKVLVHSACNQNKKNRTPFEWFQDEKKDWDTFKSYILMESTLGKRKRSYLIKENFSDIQSQSEFIARNLNDTRYMSKAIKTYCENYWKFFHDDDKLRIQVRSGKLTSTLRHQWGLDTKNRDTHTHHAIDAIIIAFSTQGMVKKLSDYFAKKERKDTKEKPLLTPPLPNFKEAVDKVAKLERQEKIQTKTGEIKILNRLLISRPPRASVTGAAHKETIQSPKEYKGRGVKVNDGKGMCDNGDMPRVDVFTKEGKYYLVPIYVADFAKGELPNKAIVQGKNKEWIEMDKTYNFLFSLAKDDLVELHQKGKVPLLGFFAGTDSATANIAIKSIETQEIFKSLGVKTAMLFKKYTIDPLGYYHEVKGEKRLGTIPQETKKRPKHEK